MEKADQKQSNVYLLRTCKADMTAHGGFKWPESGIVECPDWSSEPTCGHGLHGLLNGEGDGGLLNWDPDAKWLVVEVLASEVVEIGGKVKVPRGVVIFAGDRIGATDLMQTLCPGKNIVGSTATAGDSGTATAGYAGTATAGDSGTATAGDSGTATAGAEGTLQMRWWDGKRYRTAIFYVGEDGIEANVAYKCVDGKAIKKL